MALIRDRKLVTDDEAWQHIDDEAEIPGGDVTVSFARLLSKPALADRDGSTGVRLGPRG